MRIPLILDLDREAKRCGNCRFCERIELLYDNADLEKLKTAAQNILKTSPEKPAIRNDDVITILAVHGKLTRKSIYCSQEKAAVKLLEIACAFWQPQAKTEDGRSTQVTETIPKAKCPDCGSVKLKPCRLLQVRRWQCSRCGIYFYREQKEPYRILVNARQKKAPRSS